MDTDAAKCAKRLLDVVMEARTAAAALSEIKDRNEELLTQRDAQDLDAIISALQIIYEEGRHRTTKVSPVSNLLQGYDMWWKADRENDSCPLTVESESMWRVRKFVKKCKKDKELKRKGLPLTEKTTPPKNKKQRQSTRKVVVSPPDKEYHDSAIVAKLLKGRPPFPAKRWSKETLIEALPTLDGTRKTNAFVKAVIEQGRSEYSHRSAIFKLWKNWKEKKVVLTRGRPRSMKLTEVDNVVKSTLMDCSSDSSAFKLKDMINAFEAKKKVQTGSEGLDPNSINVQVSEKVAKAAMVAVAMGEQSGVKFTNKKLLSKTEKRYQSEH
ncbi:hypothetical protein ACHAXR_007427 [Thalassiosira sp. AJA248-18]